MSATLKNYTQWLKDWEAVVQMAEIQLEQANMVMPVIKQKIEELEKLEVQKE